MQELNLSVTGSEVVGLIPKSCLIDAAHYYMKRENLFLLEEEHKIRLAVDRMGLHSIKHFNPKEKVIESVSPKKYTKTLITCYSNRNFVGN